MTTSKRDPDTVVAQCQARLSPFLESGPLDWVVIGGSGIGAAFGDGSALPEGLKLEGALTLDELGLPAPAVAGHAKSLVFAKANGRRVAIQTGRIHPYEGHDPRVCTAALAALLGAHPKALLLTCAVGGLRDSLAAGQLVLIRDQIGLWGPTTLVGPKFIDCSQMYGSTLRAQVQDRAQALGLGALPEVVYVHARGPQYETPAEVAALRMLGGDVVGMSTTYEATLGASMGVPVVGVGLVTNSAGASGLSHTEVEAQGQQARVSILKLLVDVLSSVSP